MNVLVLDTNVVSFLMKGHRLADDYRFRLEGRMLAISFMTVGELYEGAYRAGWSRERLTKLRETLKAYVVIPFSFEICRQWELSDTSGTSRPSPWTMRGSPQPQGRAIRLW